MDAGVAGARSSRGSWKVNSSAETYVRRLTGTPRPPQGFLVPGECGGKAEGHVSPPLHSPYFPSPSLPSPTCPFLDTPVSFPPPPPPAARLSPPSLRRSPVPSLYCHSPRPSPSSLSPQGFKRHVLLSPGLASCRSGSPTTFFLHRPHLVTHFSFTTLKTFPSLFSVFSFPYLYPHFLRRFFCHEPRVGRPWPWLTAFLGSLRLLKKGKPRTTLTTCPPVLLPAAATLSFPSLPRDTWRRRPRAALQHGRAQGHVNDAVISAAWPRPPGIILPVIILTPHSHLTPPPSLPHFLP